MQDFIRAKQDQIVELCRTYHVRRLSIFGSAVRDDFNPATSDVDVRIEFESDDMQDYARNLDDLHQQLCNLLGRDVDILSAREIQNPRLRQIIERSQVTLYAA